MSLRATRLPSYRRHATGQAFVQHKSIPTKDHRLYLGKFGTPESEERYQRFIAELTARPSGPQVALAPALDGLQVVEVCAAFWQFARGYYVKNGKPSGWQVHIKMVLRLVRETYGHTPAADFGPLAFKAIRGRLVDAGHSRGYVNKLMAVVPRMFKWAAAEELVPASVYHALKTVEGLKKGRTAAHETAPVRPVEDTVVEATVPHLPRVVADMVQVQRLTGCRPGEVCIVRPCDVDRSGDVWVYRPAAHKTEHHGRERIIYIGPRAQAILRPYLLRATDAYCFSPAETVREHLAARHEARRTRLSWGNRPGTNRKRRPKRRPAECYTRDSYRRAIHRAVDRINKKRTKKATERGEKPDLLEKWAPNRLRHSAATEIRKRFGLEAAQVALGHASADVTQVYAERDARLGIEVARRIG